MKDILTKFGNYDKYAPFILRIGLGLLFFTHGMGKLFGPAGDGANFIATLLTSLGIPNGVLTGIAGYSGWLSTPVADGGLGIPAAIFFAWAIALIETFGGLALLLGLFTRLGALLLSIEFLFIVVYVRIIIGNGWETDLAYLVSLMALLIVGPGAYSLERKLFGKVRW